MTVGEFIGLLVATHRELHVRSPKKKNLRSTTITMETSFEWKWFCGLDSA